MQKALYLFLSIITLGLFNLYLRKYVNVEDETVDKEKELMMMIQQEIRQVNASIDSKMTNQNMQTMNKIDNLVNSLDNKIVNQNMKSTTDVRMLITELESKLRTQNQMSDKQIKEVIERVSKLDAAQLQMLNLTDSINNLEKVLTDKKVRGIFGELQLHNIFTSIFGEKNDLIFEEQYRLSNGKIVDAILHAPEPVGNLCIDSKFPLENYLRLSDSNLSAAEQAVAFKEFKQNIKKHLNDISDKYIIEGETATQAIMFIPSESVFAHICAEHEDLIQYSYEKKVWIASPTTLVSILTLLQVVLKDIKRSELSKQIQQELKVLSAEFSRYAMRWENIEKHINQVNNDVKEISVTTRKITKKFENIEQGEFDSY